MRRILARIPEIGLDLRPGFRGLVCFAMILARIQGIGLDLGGFWPGFRGLVRIWEDSGQDSGDWFGFGRILARIQGIGLTMILARSPRIGLDYGRILARSPGIGFGFERILARSPEIGLDLRGFWPGVLKLIHKRIQNKIMPKVQVPKSSLR